MKKRFTSLLVAGALATIAVPATVEAQVAGEVPQGPDSEILPLEQFSPTILGIYRKVMEIEDEIRRHTDRYAVDYELARAVCMYESGGNSNLTSWAGAEGYFQVMPATFRSLRVDTNIEAGVKYLGQLVRQFEREDYALAAYNGGPTNVGRGRAMRLESLQYVLGVGYYRQTLKLYERSVRHHASALQLTTVAEDEDWWALSRRLGLSLLQLRLHNPYLARRELRPGQLIAYPVEPRQDLFRSEDERVLYVSRHGDNYFNIAFTFDIDLDEFRAENGLWHLQTLPIGMTLHLPLAWEGDHDTHVVAPGDTIEAVAAALESEPWRVIRDNALWDEALIPGAELRVRQIPKRPSFVVHRVDAGDNLTVLARRYGTSVASIQEANGMGGRTTIRIGERLRIPQLAE